MSYVDSSLLPNEQVTFRTRLHWIIFFGPIFLLLIGLLVVTAPPHNVLLLLVGLAAGATAFINFQTSEFAVTNKRVIVKVGVIRRRTLELQLSKVETVSVNQGIVGRIFGFGNILITGTGGTKEPFKRIRAPLELRRATQAGTT
jgi:uncharacterized membrane protein YdbT with pleckstrin-like domain